MSLNCLLECFKAPKASDRNNAPFDGGLFTGIGVNKHVGPSYQDDDLKIQIRKRFEDNMHA